MMHYNLSQPSDQTRYKAKIDTAFRALDRQEDARALRRSIIHTLERLSRHPNNPTGLTKSNLRHLARMVGLVQPDDLLVTGGLLGGSNAWYASQLGVEPATVTAILRALKRAGMIIHYNATANHRRACQRTQSGPKDGRGYTLKPLIVNLPLLQDWARQLDREALTKQAKLGELRNLIRQNAAKLMHLEPGGLHERHARAAENARSLKVRSDLGPITSQLHDAFNLSIEIDDALLAERSRRDDFQDQSPEKSRQHHTHEKPVSTFVVAIQKERSRTERSNQQAASEAESEVGDSSRENAESEGMSCGATIAEAAILFPDDRDSLPATGHHEDLVIATSLLAEKSAINPRLLGRGFEEMGISRTFWAILLVRARQRRGEIRTAPGAYFNALVTRARAGQLDLDRSIWGERQRQVVKGGDRTRQ